MTAVRDCADRLRRLSAQGRRAAAEGDAEIDWDTPIEPPIWMPRRGVVTAISQLYYGELAAIEMCERLLPQLGDPAAENFVRSQIADEKRHVAYYGRYLRRVGDIGTIEEGVAMAYDGALAWRGSYHGAIAAFHVVLEGEGLRLQSLYSRWFPCPLFRRMNALIARDEGRHVAFGKISLREKLRALPFEERLEILTWLRSLWFDCADAIRGDMPGAVSRLVGRSWAEEKWRRQHRTLVDIGLIAEDERAIVNRL